MSDTFAAGIYEDVPELDYHSGAFGPVGSLSSTEAKRILEAPAVLRWYRDNPQPPKAQSLAVSDRAVAHVIHRDPA